MGLGGLVWEGEWCTGGKEPWRGFAQALPPLSLSRLLALSLRQEQTNRWKGFVVVGIRNPTAQGSKPSLSVCLPLLLPVLSASAQEKVNQR